MMPFQNRSSPVHPYPAGMPNWLTIAVPKDLTLEIEIRTPFCFVENPSASWLEERKGKVNTLV